MSSGIKTSQEKQKKRQEAQKIKEMREQAKLDAQVVAKANGSPSKGISIVGTQNVGKVEVDSKTGKPIWGYIRRFVHGLVKCNIG